jgi:hypothetical protein
VRSELQGSNLHGVVVFGGPPCKKFCNAAPLVRQQRDILPTAKANLDAAESRLKLLKVVGKKVVSAEERAEAESKVAQALRIYRAAADAVAQDDLGLRAAEDVVTSFLKLFQDIQMHCAAAGNVPCHLVMENPYSAADRALWNRWGRHLRPAMKLLGRSHQVE